MTTCLKTTPLNGWHRNAGANMADFGGFDMPLWYETGVRNEHLGVLKSAGIFDTSHMACIYVKGENAFDLLNLCFTRDISSLARGRCVYGAFLDAEGFCIDDAIVYKFTDTSFMVCVNAGMGETIARHLDENKQEFDADIKDMSEKLAKMDIQGINSARILSRLIKDPDQVFQNMPYFSFKGHPENDSEVRLADGTPILLSRSGYTGEFGFEIFLGPDAIVKLWTDILEAGKQFNITACGLGARDSLRAGACLPLSHQDIGHWKFINHPWDFALPWADDKKSFTKKFIGADALLPCPEDSFTYAFAGDSLRKVSAGEKTKVKDESGNEIGKVLTCATDMGITWHDGKILSIASKDLPPDIKIKGISCGFVMVNKKLEPGTSLILEEGRRIVRATIVTDIRPDRTARKKLSNFI